MQSAFNQKMITMLNCINAQYVQSIALGLPNHVNQGKYAPVSPSKAQLLRSGYGSPQKTFKYLVPTVYTPPTYGQTFNKQQSAKMMIPIKRQPPHPPQPFAISGQMRPSYGYP